MSTIICHSFPAWDTPYVKSTLELITRMSATHRVIFLDYPYTWKDYFSNPHAPKKNMLGGEVRMIETEFGTIEVYNSGPIIPTQWINQPNLFDALMKVNAHLVKPTIDRILKTVNTADVQVINAFNPVFGWYTRKFWKGIPVTYYAYDDLSSTPWAGKWGKTYEGKFLKEVEKVIVSSEGLKKKFDQLHPQVSCVKNGVNLSLFKPDFLHKAKKKLGYVGAFDERIDLELLEQVALAYPDYLIEILGPVKTTSDLPGNVIFLGSCPQDQIKDVVRDWNVCLIPFRKTPFTQSIYPLKINEYLALGKPVVSTDFADLSDFDEVVRISSDTETFIKGIHREKRSDNRLKKAKRIDFASKNSWEARSQEFLQALAS
ncbi:glycosyltransferase [Algoriphagus limi]|uniref:Glycosyltransferase n=1 Tax=Algoriphagus limi TaxID=2975273 RepID=A0ABT2G7J2_9BACT|nr:glycosyltransferase [Algoriphagus limi]MCS5491097.1 glycosyltransferase [Algoriphagus limi]